MSKIIVYIDGAKVTGYEAVETNALAAMCIGLAGPDVVNYVRACKQLGADLVASFTKTAPRKTEYEVLAEWAGREGRAFLLVEPGKLPSGEFSTWSVEGGKVKGAA